MNKQQARSLYKEKRKQLTHQQITKLDDLMLIQFQRLDVEVPDVVMGYSPIEALNEFDVEPVTRFCRFRNPAVYIVYPIIGEAGFDMHCVVIHDGTVFKKNKYGIDESVDGTRMDPKEIGLVLAPLLAFDTTGQRVGYGKGYYDRFLKQCTTDVIKIGFSYFDPLDAIDDADADDVRLDYCITPDAIYNF